MCFLQSLLKKAFVGSPIGRRGQLLHSNNPLARDSLLIAGAARGLSQRAGKVTHQKNQRVSQAMKRPVEGFTLLELLVVMVIIGLLASYVAPRFFDQIGKSEVKAARAQLDALDKALGTYRIDTGRYPSTEQGLKALIDKPQDEPKWAGPYLAKALPPDPWGRAYLYRTPGEKNREFELMSLGKDGQRGGTGDNVDISIWDSGR
jgi:general secretion pathway protein G